MKIKYSLIVAFVLILIFTECTLEPALDEMIKDEQVWKDRDFTTGIINDAYAVLPSFYTDEWKGFLDCATDNAVTNDYSSPIKKLGEGAWTASNNPLNTWEVCYQQIANINKFLEYEPSILFSNDSAKNEKLHKRLRGEAYFLRAWFQFELLSRFSGPSTNGIMLGFPIVLNYTDDIRKKALPRSTFDDCVKQIENDIDSSLLYLPEKQYAGKDDVVLGENQIGRAYKLVALSLRSRLSLYAASPAYTVNKTAVEKQLLWEKAALDAMEAINESGTLPTVNISGDIYTNPSHAEIIWRKFQPEDNSPERENFYPSIWGYGRTNPSQQLVDAFPMRNGYPIDEAVNYDKKNPYENRDNRFSLTILFNDATFGSNPKPQIYVGGLDHESTLNQRTSRTGYYLRKFMNPAVNIIPGTTASTAKHYYVFFRKAELWLNYAEAANEAWGPNENPLGMSKTSKVALGELRRRAGISQPDTYLENTAAAGVDKMRLLIQNERRIELCFENQRFFDVRRWLLPLDSLNQTIKGVVITKDLETEKFDYAYYDIEQRNFQDYMYYGPIPEQEIYTSGGVIEQNLGWK